MNVSNARFRVWDVPVRLVHWALVVLVLLQWGTAEWGWLDMQWHARFGYLTLGLVLFRIAWGFAGGGAARFASFVRGPRAVAAYVRDLLARRDRPQATHNPLGGWAVLALLALLLAQAVTGLFASDEITLDGPFVRYVGADLVEAMTETHEVLKTVLLVVIGLHLAAVLAHQFGKGEDLIQGMLSGRRRLPEDPRWATAGWVRAVILAALSLGVIWAISAAG